MGPQGVVICGLLLLAGLGCLVEFGNCQYGVTTFWDGYRTRQSPTTWSLAKRLPMISTAYPQSRLGDDDDEYEDAVEARKGKLKKKFKKFKKYLLPLLLAYKLKFFTLIPVLIGGLILLTGATGLAGFFFALFAAVMGLKSGSHH